MKRVIICISIIFGCVIFCSSSHAGEFDVNRNLGIGLQGNVPLLGGISIRYYGLSPVSLQVVGRFIMDGDDRDNMIGGGISYDVFKRVSSSSMTRLYFGLESGGRYEKERIEDEWYDYEEDVFTYTEELRTKKTYGFGIVFGGEFVFPFLGTQFGWNMELGQGLGRIREDGKSRDTSSIIWGTGIHVYF